MSKFVFDLQRFAATTVISGTSGNDNIFNEYDDSATINAGAGNDTIENYGDEVLINAGTGNDSITNSGYEATINAGAGNDRIYNYDSYASISGGAGNDSIYNDGYYASINGGAGNDRITLAAVSNLVQYATGDGNDTIWGFNETDTLTITGGASYSTQTSGDNVIVTVGKGKITLVGAKDKTLNINGNESTEVITLTKGADTLSNNLDKVTINAGAGNNSIYNSGGDDTTINTGVGNDSIINEGSSASINAGAGNDSITNEGLKTTINAGTGNDSITNSSSGASINAGAGNDSITNSSSGASINAGAGNDYISNSGYNADDVTINTGVGNDSIINDDSATINAGAGNDTIENYGDEVLINAGTGNDSITNTGAKVSIYGGTGNDRISLTSVSNLIQYKSGDGNDTIYGFNESDTLTITGGKYSTQASGDDVIVTVGKGSILLVGANDKDLNINKKKSTEVITLTKRADTLSNDLDNISINGGTGNDSISNSAVKVTLNGGAGNDIIHNSYSSDNVTISGGAGDDSLWGGSGKDTFIYSNGNGNDMIYSFDDNDLLKITGTFSGTYSKLKGEVYFKVGDTSNAITLKDFTATSFHVNGDTYKISGTKLVKDS